MKSLKKLKLNDISAQELSELQMKRLMGGASVTCGCACAYAGSGGSSDVDNCKANYSGGASGGLNSPGGSYAAICRGSNNL